MKTRQTPALLFLIAVLALVLPSSLLAQNVYWNFGTTNTGGVAIPTSGVPAGVSVSAISQGNINGTVTMLSTTSASSGYTGASGQFNAGAAARIGALNTATNAYFEFTVTPQANYEFTLTGISFGSRETSTGPKAYSLRSSADNYAADLATGTMLANSTWALKSNTGLSQTSQLPVTYRLYGHSGTGSPSANTINWRIDDLTVTLSSQSIGGGSPAITSAASASGVAYDSFSYQITASNTPNSFGAQNLPAGLSIDTTTGIISGTPTVVGVFNVTITATNASGTGSGILTLTLSKNPGAPTISSLLTSTGLVNSSYAYQIVANNTPTSYSAGTLPAGLTVDTATGLISGTPTVGGVFNVAISASNALGTDTQTLVITINSAPVITSPTSGSLYATNNFDYTISASFTPTSYGASNLPAGWTVTSSNGVITNGSTPLTTGTVSFGISATNSFGTGSATYTLKVFDQAMQDAVPLNVVVNKYLNGTPDKVQLLVIGTGTPGSTVDMRGMIIKDFSSSMANDSGGKFIFADNAIWSAVPAGTLITLSSGTTQTEDIDVTDFYIAVNLGNATYFTNGGGSFEIATTDMLLLKSAGSGVSGVAGGIHALAGGTAGAQFTAYTGAKLRATGTSGTDLGVMALNSTSQLSDYGASGQTESLDAQGGQTSASLNFASWNSPGNESYVKLLRGIIDGTGTASIVNGAGDSDFFGQNIFGRNQSNQTVAISYLPASTQTAITTLAITVPSEMGAPAVSSVSVAGAGAGSAVVAVTNQVVTISGLNALNPDPVEISISGLTTPDTALSVTNSGRYAFSVQSQGSGGSLAPLGSSPSAVVIIPIANARNADPTTFVPTLLGQTIAVEGVANVAKLGTGQINSALQDGSYGIGTYSASVANLPIRGNRYVVSGAVQQSSGYVRVNITNAGAIYDFGATNDPAPVTVTVPQLNAATGATNGINLQSRVIRLENLSYVSGTWSNNSTVTLRDTASNNVAVRIQANSSAVSAPSYPVTLTGIAGQFDSASPFDTGFQIQPRDQADAPVLPPAITSALTATATNGVAFQYQITTDNNPPATAFGATPLPAGLTVNASTGLISGTPTATGVFNISISATNAGGTDTETLVLTVIASGQTFANWAQGAPLNSTNLLLYAVGGASSPTATNGVASTTALTSSNLSITAVVRTNDTALSTFGYAVTNLVTSPWSSNGVTMTPAVSQVGVPEGCQMQIFSTPRDTDAAKFLRLQSTLTNQ